MKKIRLFKKFEIEFHFSFKRVKRIWILIPDWADDAHLNQGGTGDWGTSDGKPKVVYYKGSTRYELCIPYCKHAIEISCTPLRKPGSKEYNTNRYVVIDLYY